ncbi:MAG TPA: glycosyltransferase [Gammaproteobacteria bacterium]|nr:glycosyltransferase [Gammaproteobacteria bacterium]
MAMRILFAVHDWGLGHAARSLVLIRALLARGDEVTVLMADSAGLQLLKNELGASCAFRVYRDIPKPFSRWPFMFYLRMSLSMPWVWLHYKLEHRLTEKLVAERGFDLVVSDSRFGIWSRAVPSYCIFHSLRQIIPGRLRWMERLVEWGQRRLLKHYRKVLIPDVEEGGGLSGDLGHYPALDWGEGRLVYLGPLADVARPGLPEDIDYFFSVSGIEPQRGILERRVLAALPELRGCIVVTLGRPELAGEERQIAGATVYGYLDRARQAEMLNRAHVIVTRSGYTTLMELATLGKRALFVPTPGQSEQEYLAHFHHERGQVWATTQGRLDIPRDLVHAAAASGLPRLSAAESVGRFLAVIG